MGKYSTSLEIFSLFVFYFSGAIIHRLSSYILPDVYAHDPTCGTLRCVVYLTTHTMDGMPHEAWKEFENRGFNEGRNPPVNNANFYLELNTSTSESAPASASTVDSHKSSLPSDDGLYDWLQNIHMDEYYDSFVNNDISLDIMPHLTKADLKGIVFKVGDRIRIMNAINTYDWSLVNAIDKADGQNVYSTANKTIAGDATDSTDDLSMSTLTVDRVTVRFYTLQNKALHLDIAPGDDIVQMVLQSAKIPPDEKVSINDGFDAFNNDAALRDAIFDSQIREFWINPDPDGISYSAPPTPSGRRVAGRRTSSSRASSARPDSVVAPSATDLLAAVSIDNANFGKSEDRPTSLEVARNISQFFPESKHEVLARGLRNSMILNNRLSTITGGSNWRASVRMSRRLSMLKPEAPVPASKEQSAASEPELDSRFLEQLDSEEMSPTEWLRGKIIGSGSFGSVYLAFNVFSGDIMAVKQVEISGIDQRQRKMLDVLNHEIHILRNLEHENIVQYKGSKKEGDFLNIFLEYVPGGSLASKLAFQGALKEDTIRHYIIQCLRGLAYLHERGIIHRDIKGANILVDTFDCVKISDFGLSKHENAARNRISTQGTAFWMAPEVARAKEKTTTKADIWSLGCMIVELITGQHPFPDLQVFQVLYRVGKGETPAIPEMASPLLKEVLSRCFVVDTNQRASARELLELPFFKDKVQ